MTIPPAIREAILSHAKSEAPNECCGFLAGRDGIVEKAIPLVNELASPIEYTASAASLFAAFKAMRAEGLELLAVYHSHPTSHAVPSRRDLNEWTYGDVAMVIASLPKDEVTSWRIEDGMMRKLEL